MVYPIDSHKKTPELLQRFKELKTARLSPRNRQMITHFEQWLNRNGFLTNKQKLTFDEIYEKARVGKAQKKIKLE